LVLSYWHWVSVFSTSTPWHLKPGTFSFLQHVVRKNSIRA
jgi:hypothetical protein